MIKGVSKELFKRAQARLRKRRLRKFRRRESRRRRKMSQKGV